MSDRKLALLIVIVSARWIETVYKMNPSGDRKDFGSSEILPILDVLLSILSYSHTLSSIMNQNISILHKFVALGSCQ